MLGRSARNKHARADAPRLHGAFPGVAESTEVGRGGFPPAVAAGQRRGKRGLVVQRDPSERATVWLVRR